MAYIKTDWADGDVISEAGLDHLENGVYNNSVAIGDLTDLDTTDKTNLVAAINEVAQSGGGGGGMSNAVKDALLQIASKVAYIDADGQDYYDDLYDALYPGATIVSIQADYTQTGTVYPTASLDDLRNDLVVNAIYDNGSVVPVISYTLSGTLEEGTSTITVTYEGFTDTFDVEVTAAPTLSSISAVYTQSGTVYDTDSLDSLKSDLVVTAAYSDSSTATVPSADYTLSGTLTEGASSSITVTYSEKTTTFTVTVSTGWRYLPSAGNLSEQTYVSLSSGTYSVTETVEGDTLKLTGATNPTSINKGFLFSPTTYSAGGYIKVVFKVSQIGYYETNSTSSNVGAVAFRLSNGTGGSNVGFPRYGTLSADLKTRYKIGNTAYWVGDTFSVGEWHTLKIINGSSKQTIELDGTAIATNENLSTQYTTANAMYVYSDTLSALEVYFKEIEYNED